MSMTPAEAAQGCDALPDRELVALCLDAGQRKDEAFAALYARYADRVFGFLIKVTYDRVLAAEPDSVEALRGRGLAEMRLGLEDDALQSLYHFTLGGPVDDERLVTLPPYAHLAERAAR